MFSLISAYLKVCFFLFSINYWISLVNELAIHLYWTTARVKQKFSNILVMCGTIQKFGMLLPRSWRWQTTLDCEMLSSPDTLPVLLAGFAEIVKVTNYTRLWDAELSWYSSRATCWVCRDREGDKPHWTVRCCSLLILSPCYSLDLPRSWRWHTTLNCEMLSSPDTLPV